MCSTSSTTEDARISSSSPVASTSRPSSWFGRVLGTSFDFSIRRRRRKCLGAEHAATIENEHKPRAFETVYANVACEVSSIPSISRLHSTVSTVSGTSSPGVGPLALSTPVEENDVMCALKGMQASVPESPQVSLQTSLPPTLEGEDGNSSRRPSYSVNIPQLYPYTLSEDDLWAAETVATILAVRPFLPSRSPCA